MKKIMFFPLWRIEKLEKYLEDMEQKGLLLEKIKYSYFFYFKESAPKQMRYFLSYKSFRGQSMGNWDYALTSRHSANEVKSKMCFYTMYRIKAEKDLLLLYETRLDFIKTKLLENALASFFLTILFVVIAFFPKSTHITHKGVLILGVILAVCVWFTIYYFYGYLKQKIKCKNYEASLR